MRLIAIPVLAALLSLTAAFAQTVLVYPFQDDGSMLGEVLADRVASALEPLADLVAGPATTPGLVPPFAYQEGYLVPLALLDAPGPASRHGAAIVRGAAGADIAMTGALTQTDDGYQLEVFLASGAQMRVPGVTRLVLNASEEEVHLLAQQAAALVAFREGWTQPALVDSIDLTGADELRSRVLTLIGGGFPSEAGDLLDEVARDGTLEPRLDAWREAIAAAKAGTPARDALDVAALAALALVEDDQLARSYFRPLADLGLHGALAWMGALAADAGDLAAADDAYAEANAAYNYGAAARFAYRASQGGDLRDLARLTELSDPATLVVLTLLADLADDETALVRALDALIREAPRFAWAYERRSYVAFDQDDALAAAEALTIATALVPDSDLYWTNLGWAYYLLGFYDRSEQASMRAVEISPDAFIAAYNLGLVRARFGRLADAMPLYEQALARDPEVDDEALADIENALIDLPQEPALHYALGRLYEAEGRRAEAAEAYATYVELGGFGAPYDAAAERRVAVLTAPPAPLEIAGDLLDVTLGGALAPAPLHPGDPLHVEFELVTPGEALPGRVEVTTRLLDGAGSELARSEVPIEVPADAIGYVLEEPFLELPIDLDAGAYVLEVQVASFEGPTVSAEVAIDVAGQPTPLRQLVGRNVRLLSLTGGRTLYDADDVANPGRIVNAMIGELRVAVEAAEENLPVIEEGRFAGMSGGAVFETSGVEEVRAFLAYVAADGVRDLEIAFVDAYAQWVIEGAPDGD